MHVQNAQEDEMLKENIIFAFLTMFSVEDMRKKRISLWLVLVFLAAGIIFQAVTGKLTFLEVLGGASLGIFLLGISRATHEAMGYGDGLIFLATGVFLGIWENFQLLFTSLVMACIFSAIQMLFRKKSGKDEMAFVPFIWISYLVHLGGVYVEKII